METQEPERISPEKDGNKNVALLGYFSFTSCFGCSTFVIIYFALGSLFVHLFGEDVPIFWGGIFLILTGGLVIFVVYLGLKYLIYALKNRGIHCAVVLLITGVSFVASVWLAVLLVRGMK